MTNNSDNSNQAVLSNPGIVTGDRSCVLAAKVTEATSSRRIYSRRRFSCAGSSNRIPFSSYLDPWQGQSQLASSSFQFNLHPKCVQRKHILCSLVLSSCLLGLSSCFLYTTFVPGQHHPAVNPTTLSPTSARKLPIPAFTRSLWGENNSAHVFSFPVM